MFIDFGNSLMIRKALDIIWMQLEVLIPRLEERRSLFQMVKADVTSSFLFSGIIKGYWFLIIVPEKPEVKR
jgi:hypothetical protein